jgi:hypothetical protein
MVFTGGNPGPLDSWNTIRGKFTLANQPAPAPSAIVSNLTVASGKPYQVVDDGLVPGASFFIDRDHVLESIPESMAGATYIKTANDDKSRTESAFLSFQVNQNVTVYVAYDSRASALPNWLQDWNSTGQSIGSTDVSFKLYSRDFAASSTLTLGGNMATGASGAGSNYFVVLDVASPANNTPNTVMVSPADGASFLTGDTITFSGTATDFEDGDLTQSLVWSSSLDGELGRGGSVQASLSAGEHMITLMATDSQGASGTDAVTITVVNLVYGDANQDGQFTGDDIYLVVDWVIGRKPLPQVGSASFVAADVDGGGSIEADDAVLMIDRLLGELDKFPVEP